MVPESVVFPAFSHTNAERPRWIMKGFFLIFPVFVALWLSVSSVATAIEVDDFDSIRRYTLTNSSGMTVQITNYGAIITSILVPDRNGNLGDVALGYGNVESYLNAVDKPYFGAIVGRYGNRIAKGKFELDGTTYQLATNNAPNHLHGGGIGFDKVAWDAKPHPERNAIELSYVARDGEEGYPGEVRLTVTYTLTEENEIRVDYHAVTTEATPFNVTQHTYFNLKGEGDGDILDHELMIHADRYTPVDASLIPTGELAPVNGTPMDFTEAKPIGRDIAADHVQLKYGGGFDHNWVLNRPAETPKHTLTLAAEVYEPTTGRTLTVTTTEPGVQFYCGNFLDGRLIGKSGRPYLQRGGLCLETQHFPDSPNQPTFPSTILRPGQPYVSTTVMRFGAR